MARVPVSKLENDGGATSPEEITSMENATPSPEELERIGAPVRAALADASIRTQVRSYLSQKKKLAYFDRERMIATLKASHEPQEGC
jgi:hypothetical protein